MINNVINDINSELSCPLDEATYSVLINLAATVGIMYANREVDDNLLPWSTFEGELLPDMVREFIQTHEVFSNTYEEDLKAFAEESLRPDQRGRS